MINTNFKFETQLRLASQIRNNGFGVSLEKVFLEIQFYTLERFSVGGISIFNESVDMLPINKYDRQRSPESLKGLLEFDNVPGQARP